MLHIAICDDLADQLEQIRSLTNEYLEKMAIDADVRCFSHPDALLTAAESARFHIYILDIIMPMLSGVELGTQLRRLDREAQIIYATTAPEFALDSFAANPLCYLIKPVQKQKLFDALTLALSKVDRSGSDTIAVKTREGLRVLNFSSIVCCELIKNAVRYTLSSGEVLETRSIRTAFAEHVKPHLACGYFLQPHTSFILNMNRVERVTTTEFMMRGGAVVPIAKKQLAEAKQAYLDYIFKAGKGL